MNRAVGICVGVAAALMLATPVGLAHEPPQGCAGFAWSLEREKAALAASSAGVESGAPRTLSHEAVTIRLRSGADAALPKAPEQAAKRDRSFAGYLAFPGPPSAGLVQITLSAAAWVDVIQNGTYLKPKAFTGAVECPGVRKSMRYEIDAGPFVLQLSDVVADTIGVVVAPATAD